MRIPPTKEARATTSLRLTRDTTNTNELATSLNEVVRASGGSDPPKRGWFSRMFNRGNKKDQPSTVNMNSNTASAGTAPVSGTAVPGYSVIGPMPGAPAPAPAPAPAQAQAPALASGQSGAPGYSVVGPINGDDQSASSLSNLRSAPSQKPADASNKAGQPVSILKSPDPPSQQQGAGRSTMTCAQPTLLTAVSGNTSARTEPPGAPTDTPPTGPVKSMYVQPGMTPVPVKSTLQPVASESKMVPPPPAEPTVVPAAPAAAAVAANTSQKSTRSAKKKETSSQKSQRSTKTKGKKKEKPSKDKSMSQKSGKKTKKSTDSQKSGKSAKRNRRK